jgi:hypothetical protein
MTGESETDHDRRPVLAVGSLKAWESRGSGPLNMGTGRHAPRSGRFSFRARSDHSWTKPPPRFLWALSALLVAVGWLLTPHPVPVYDGIGMPDEPYRYVSTPPGASVTALPAGTAQGILPVVGGVNSELGSMISNEFGPQVSVYLPVGVLTAPGGKITVKVVPEAPSQPPADGPIDGNVYRVSITDPAGPVTFNSSKSMIYLRATTAKQPGPVIEQRLGPGQKWRLLDTTRAGNDVYSAVLPETGEYAVVYSKLAHARDATPGSGPGGNHGLIVGLFVLFFLLICVVFAVRSRGKEVDT